MKLSSLLSWLMPIGLLLPACKPLAPSQPRGAQSSKEASNPSENDRELTSEVSAGFRFIPAPQRDYSHLFTPLDPALELSTASQANESENEAIERINAVLTSVDLRSEQLAGKPNILVGAHEATHFANIEEVSQIISFQNKQYDVFVLHQEASHKSIAFDYSRWRKYAIVVDKNLDAPRMYFYRIPGDNIPILARGGRGDDCTHCHASGPRAVRPKESKLLEPLSQETFELINDFNDYVNSYGVDIEGFAPLEDRVTVYAENNMLKMKKCFTCHNPDSPKGALFRIHKPAILTLVKTSKTAQGYHVMSEQPENAAMPPGSALTREEVTCLELWLEADTDVKGCEEILGLEMDLLSH